MLTVSTLFAQVASEDLETLIDQLRNSPPLVAPHVLPTLPNQGGTESTDHGAKYSSVIQIDCDGVRHQVAPAHFGAWADEMLASNVREARVVMPYNPHGDEGVELWRLGRWPELEVLDLKDFSGRNVVRTGPKSWTTRGAVSGYPSVRKLWVSYGRRPSFGRFPKLEEVWFAEHDKDALVEAQRLGPSVKAHTYERDSARPKPIPNYSYLREAEDIATLTQLTVQGPLVNKDLSELARCTELRELLCHHVDLLVDLRPIAGLKQLETLELVDCSKVTSLAGLEELTTLKKLSIIESGAKIRSEDFKQLVNLEFLRLCWCENLVDLSVLPNHAGLRHLDLSGTKVADLGPLRRMKNLQVLCLDHATNLTELGFLRQMPSVRRLVVTNGPHLPMSEIRKLQSILPDCAVHFDAWFPDSMVSVSVSDTSVVEGRQLELEFWLDKPTVWGDARLEYDTVPQTAGNADFEAKSGRVVFRPGETVQRVVFNTTSDSEEEPTESFRIKLSAGVGCMLSRDNVFMIIVDNDTPPTIRTQLDSNSDVVVSLSNPYREAIRFDWEIFSGRVASADRTNAGSATFPPDSDTLVIPIDEAVKEDDRGFNVRLSSPSHGTLKNGGERAFLRTTNPVPSAPQVVGPVRRIRLHTGEAGWEGISWFKFATTISGGESCAGTDWSLVHGTTSDADWGRVVHETYPGQAEPGGPSWTEVDEPGSGTSSTQLDSGDESRYSGSFAWGRGEETVHIIWVEIRPDNIEEPVEHFKLRLTSPWGAIYESSGQQEDGS